MTPRVREVDAACGVAQAAAVMGDWWNLLVLREVARGQHRFDGLVAELAVSRRVLTERLAHLVEHGVLERSRYQDRPPRYEYRLTPRGEAFLPVLVGMQDWADRWLLGDGTLTATAPPAGPEGDRVRALVGTAVPPVSLPSATGPRDVLAETPTVLFAYPATGRPNPHPAGWGGIAGTIGCTLENRLFRDRLPDFAAAGVAVHGVSTQRPEEQAAFAAEEGIPFPLLSDVDLALAAALRLPTVRIAQQQRLKRLVLVADRDRVVRHTIFPVTDIPAAVDDALTVARTL
ncbi:winged helix-turn-helix transcriptional regulator [Asanoa sp. NPDC050611]|uniref:winged helix-turn-helix transcriptional regulator n=1 Tax=Asanoa sp. NPDC050611 TaxID=3157098 RepID=UPI00340876EB